MADLILTLLAALIVGSLAFGVFAFTLGRDPGLSEPAPDRLVVNLPDDRPLAAKEVRDIRLDTALRGYRMDQVDRLVSAAAATIDELSERVEALEAEVAELRRVRNGDPA